MKAAQGCKLFGAYEALAGIRDSIVLLHSVVGCNFGTMALGASCGMERVRQTCTVISDTEVVFGGETSVEKALVYVEELYQPRVIFVVTGCVSDMIQDDIRSVAQAHRGQARVLVVEAAGYRGRMNQGYEPALASLAALMKEGEKAHLSVNLLGLGANDVRLVQDVKAMGRLLGPGIHLRVLSCCGTKELEQASGAGLNLVAGRGAGLAREMEKRFGIPWEEIRYPYGLTGAKEIWSILQRRFSLDYSQAAEDFSAYTGKGLASVYAYLQALYGMPAAVIGTRARSRGMARFLEQELGMEVTVRADREDVEDLEDFYDQVRASEAALLFGSSFEKELAEEMGIPLLRFDYPAFDRICVSDRPYVGMKGTICLVEDIQNEIMAARNRKGALYQ